MRGGERGTVICYADSFMPKSEAERIGKEDHEVRTIGFLKRFTVFNVDQCDGLPADLTDTLAPTYPAVAVEQADAIVRSSGLTFGLEEQRRTMRPVRTLWRYHTILRSILASTGTAPRYTSWGTGPDTPPGSIATRQVRSN